MTERIALVQHGDYPGARRLVAAGAPEPYFAMAYSVRTLDDFLRGRPHLVLSLDEQSPTERNTDGEYIGLPLPGGRGPRSLAYWRWGGQIVRELRRFEPTHLLLRTGGLVAVRALRYAAKHGVNTCAIFASFFDTATRHDQLVNPWVTRLLNRPNVRLAGNHRWPATDSMIACGLQKEKAAAWDWPGIPHPRDHQAKQLDPGREPEIVYIGMAIVPKGLTDLVDAVALLRQRGRLVRLTVIGDGDALPGLRARNVPGVTILGKVGNAEAFARLKAADLACVPSRPEFREGFPLSLTEALAARTPVLASDHPVFLTGLVDGEGVRIFRASDPTAIADAAERVLSDPAEYARLSESTGAAFARLECPTSFGDLLQRWRATS